MNKILYIANTDRHIELCHLPYLKMLKDNGYEVHVATNTNKILPYCDKKISIPITRNPFHFSNIKAIKLLTKIINEENYIMIHCHTPMGGVIGRISSIKYRKNHPKFKVIYTAHGFHFYKGANMINWILYYPIEKYLSKYTDIIITMNNEDYQFALKHFKTNVKFIHGIGFDSKKLDNYDNVKLKKIKQELNLNENDFVIIYVAEISKRKRQKYLIREISKINMLDNNIKLLLIGDKTFDVENYISRYSLNSNIIYIPFQKEINYFYDLADVVISVSRQEGMPLNILEALYKNKFVIATNIRGQKELINQENGFLIELKDGNELRRKILELKNNSNLLNIKKTDVKKYTVEEVKKEIISIYEEGLDI